MGDWVFDLPTCGISASHRLQRPPNGGFRFEPIPSPTGDRSETNSVDRRPDFDLSFDPERTFGVEASSAIGWSALTKLAKFEI